MNIDFYRTFLTVIQTKSFTKTANLSNLSQSTVSNRIQELEKFYGYPLFDRVNNKIVTTSYGKALISYAENLISIEDDASQHLDKLTNLSQTIHIGSVHAYYDPYMKEYIQGHLNHDTSLLKIDLRHSKDIVQGVLSSKYDMGISHHATNFSLYKCELLCTDDLILVGSSNYEEYKNGITINKLKSQTVFHSNLFDEHVEADLFNMLTYSFSMDISDKIIEWVIKYKACTFLPRKMVDAYLREGTLIEMPLLDYKLPPLSYYLIYKEGNPHHSRLKKESV